jgi:hypothetical protein
VTDNKAIMTPRPILPCLALLAACLFGAAPAHADNAAAPVADPVLERPTLRSLGSYWIVRGDDNKNATVRVDYRKADDADWHQGPPLFRVEKGRHVSKEHGSPLKVPDDAWLFAGSVVMLQPDTPYDLRLTLSDPDGGNVAKTFSTHTIAEPVAPKGPVHHVVPGNGGGTGTPSDPFHGITTAEQHAKPGDTFLLHAGVYEGAVTLHQSGRPGKPIVWRGAGDGEAILDGQGKKPERPERTVEAVGLHDVWFENLTIRNAKYALVGHESARLVVRRCHMYGIDFGLAATKNTTDAVNDYFVSDNVIEGPSVWPRSRGIEDARGIQLTGAGHVVCYNRIRGFADAIDTMPSPRCEAIDFHNNDVSEMTDDGAEMDYSQRNTRCFENRFTNVYQGISVQPVYGGPVYVFRNVLYNVCVEPFKMHNSPSGAIMIHNTVVKKGMPLMVFTRAPMSNCVYRNNLFVGTPDTYAYQVQTQATDCDFDYDGFAGGPFDNFLKWNNIRYATLKDVHEKAPVERHAVQLDSTGLFASGTLPPADEKKQVAAAPDLRLAPDTAALNVGQPLPGFNDGFSGTAPDLGAYEVGSPLPHYGPRPADER